MKLRMPVIAYAVARTGARWVITALGALGLNVRDSFVGFGSNVRPWKRAAMWNCLALNLVLAFALATRGNVVSFMALFGCCAALNYLDSTDWTKVRP